MKSDKIQRVPTGSGQVWEACNSKTAEKMCFFGFHNQSKRIGIRRNLSELIILGYFWVFKQIELSKALRMYAANLSIAVPTRYWQLPNLLPRVPESAPSS